MSQQGVLTINTGGGATIETLSSEGGPHTPPNGHNFNFSGSTAGGSAANGAIEFITPGGPGHATNGQMDAIVLTDGVTITINGSNQLSAVGGSMVEKFAVDASTPPGTNPVLPTVGSLVTVTGGQVAAGTTTNVIRTDSLTANTYTIQVQRSQAVGSSTIGDNGVCHFNSSHFTVDANGFVDLRGAAGETITGDTGGALTPTAGNWNILSKATAGASVVTSGSASTLRLNVTDSSNNTFIGLSSGSTWASGGGGHTALGYNALSTTNASTQCTAIGYISQLQVTAVTGNTSLGHSTLRQLLTGNYNLALGLSAGSSYTTSESSNICIGNNGIISESHVTRIGTQGNSSGQQNTCYIAGIVSNTVSNQQLVTINSSTGQLGVTSLTPTNYNYTPISSSPYSILSTDEYLGVTTTGGPITVKLANAPTTGQSWVIKDTAGNSATNAITITTVGGAVTIDGATSYTISTNYQAIEVIFNGTNYEVF